MRIEELIELRKSGLSYAKIGKQIGRSTYCIRYRLRSYREAIESSSEYKKAKRVGVVRGPASDLSGTRFGRLVVVCNTGTRKGRCYLWECLCDCGETTSVPTNHLKNGHTQSCGCLQVELASKRFSKDITGQSFGLLTALSPTKGRGPSKGVQWLCRCACGQFVKKEVVNLNSGEAKSCGCHKLIFPPEAYELPFAKRNTKYLSDNYIKGMLVKGSMDANRSKITPEVIELKRLQLRLYRLKKREGNHGSIRAATDRIVQNDGAIGERHP